MGADENSALFKYAGDRADFKKFSFLMKMEDVYV